MEVGKEVKYLWYHGVDERRRGGLDVADAEWLRR
jgi:hypothetical protein